MSHAIASDLNRASEKLTALTELFGFLLRQDFKNPVFSTSLGQEDQVITHHIASNTLPIKIFTLDTGRIFQETYDVLDITQKKYNITIDVFAPSQNALEDLVTKKGPNSFYESVENRKECCGIRKIVPLKRALKGKDLWITGLRQAQSENRATLDYFSYDEHFDIIKFNPLAKWELSDVNAYLKENKVPQNSLHAKGFVSIGCAPCTRAIENGEDIRAGRWWWESSKKECGLHTIKS
ncbi:MAG: phosphoadenylyl-sulfate reductase [Flavobacteriaceae bacterium]|nr:phosphoadenylyl-sulfate reductase [Flavobacteriaceae bacterium]